MWIPIGKVLIAFIWVFWVTVVGSSVEGNPNENQIKDKIELLKPEYNPTYGSTFKRVLERGYLICGGKDAFPGFGEEVWDPDEGRLVFIGFDIDICRAVAAAVFLDKNAVQIEVVDGKTRFTYLISGTIDLLSANTTYTYTRNVLKKLEFLPTTYYDGQGFMVRKTLGVSSAKQMIGARICYSSTGTAAKNIKDFFKKHFLNYIPVEVPVDDRPKDYYIDRKCDMYGTDRSALASNRIGFKFPERHIILPETISKEPLGPVVKYGDQQWSDIIRWTVYVLIIAEERGITSKNIDSFKNHIDPMIQRFMGEVNGTDHPHLGAKLGLKANWAYEVIKQVGNYAEIYERNIGTDTPLALKRELNKLYSDGGLLYAPPLK
jgi:general L-amino acid transport system substrate-binding protein